MEMVVIKQVIAIGLKVISKSNIPRKNIKSSVWGNTQMEKNGHLWMH